MQTPSSTHLVLIPTYNAGTQVVSTVKAARQQWAPVWIVVDGSTDGSTEALQALAAKDSAIRLLVQPQNQGKGAAVLKALDAAKESGFTHVLCMDSDGQHPADKIPEFMSKSQDRPECMVLGIPIFDSSAPALRVQGRKLSNWWANVETLWMGIGDSLYGFRIYPVEPLCQIMHRQHWMRRFDFDPEAVVRLCWAGVHPLNLPAPVRYLSREEGGISHFNYWRDNKLLTWMHLRLMAGFFVRLPMLCWRRLAHNA